MKKLLHHLVFSFVLSLVFVSSVFASGRINSQYLEDSDGTDWNSKAMTTATGTYYSKAIPMFPEYSTNRPSLGYCALLVTTSAGSLAITYELSDDGTNFYTPYDNNGTALNTIYAAMTTTAPDSAGTHWVVFSPRIAKYIRIKVVDTSANTTVTAKFFNLEETN